MHRQAGEVKERVRTLLREERQEGRAQSRGVTERKRKKEKKGKANGGEEADQAEFYPKLDATFSSFLFPSSSSSSSPSDIFNLSSYISSSCFLLRSSSVLTASRFFSTSCFPVPSFISFFPSRYYNSLQLVQI